VSQLSSRLEAENRYLKEELRAEQPSGIVGESVAIRRVLAEIESVAPTQSTVLLLGETGTGKELLASALHELSPRRGRAFVKVNCAAISPSLIESELFATRREHSLVRCSGGWGGSSSPRVEPLFPRRDW